MQGELNCVPECPLRQRAFTVLCCLVPVQDDAPFVSNPLLTRN